MANNVPYVFRLGKPTCSRKAKPNVAQRPLYSFWNETKSVSRYIFIRDERKHNIQWGHRDFLLMWNTRWESVEVCSDFVRILPSYRTHMYYEKPFSSIDVLIRWRSFVYSPEFYTVLDEIFEWLTFSACQLLYLYLMENPAFAWSNKEACHATSGTCCPFASHCRHGIVTNRAWNDDERPTRLCYYTPSFV